MRTHTNTPLLHFPLHEQNPVALTVILQSLTFWHPNKSILLCHLYACQLSIGSQKAQLSMIQIPTKIQCTAVIIMGKNHGEELCL